MNLSILYTDPEFQASIAESQANINGFEYGMGKYGAAQSEVIIERDSVSPDDIYALGGYSSQPEELGRVIFGRNATPAEIQWMREAIRKNDRDFGAWWIDGDAKDRVVRRTLEQVPALLQVERQQRASKRRRP